MALRGDTVLTDNIYAILAVMTIGTGLYGLRSLPYSLQVAHGWTSLGLIIRCLFLVCYVPLIILMTQRYGAVGAAGAWTLLNGASLFVWIPVMHLRLLRGRLWKWFAVDVGLPLWGPVPWLSPRGCSCPALYRAPSYSFTPWPLWAYV
ncbi:hypothetical protein ACFL2Q_18730 [Thermodesulfobacteriota bacterium]